MKIQKAAFIAFPASDFEASMIFYRDLLALPIIAEGTEPFRDLPTLIAEVSGFICMSGLSRFLVLIPDFSFM
jgi:hypothetical protein